MILSGEATAESICQMYLDRIAAVGPTLNAFLSITPTETLLRQARRADRNRHDANAARKLLGLPIAIKDNVCTRQARTTAGSPMLARYQPTYDATVVERIAQADGLIIGKTAMDEFGMGSSSENPHFGSVRNPWSLGRVAGGSSGGSAAAVAADLIPWAIGSDTGGSIRQPAAFCGITGLKPSYGRVSRNGLIAYASSLDQLGPLARTARDVAWLMNLIAGPDSRDATCWPDEPPDFLAGLDQPLRGLRIGVCPSWWDEPVDPHISQTIQSALDLLVAEGARVLPIQMPHASFAVPAYYVIACCEASSNLSRYDGVRFTQRDEANRLDAMYRQTRARFLGPEVKRRILLGTFALSAGYYDQYYVQASRVRQRIRKDYQKAFDRVDVIAGPTTAELPFRLGEKSRDPIAMYASDTFTVAANLAGLPAISFPCGFADGLPIGMQLTGRHFGEPQLLNVVDRFQQLTDYHRRRATCWTTG